MSAHSIHRVVLFGLVLAGVPWLVGRASTPTEQVSEADRQARIASMYAGYRSSFPDVPEIEASALLNGIPEDAVLVDVRTLEEQRVSMLPGAISQQSFQATPEQHAGKRIILYCTIGARSGQAAAELRKQGWDAYNIPGSVLAWSHAGGRFVQEGESTKRVHVYGPQWDLLADGYEATW